MKCPKCKKKMKYNALGVYFYAVCKCGTELDFADLVKIIEKPGTL